MKYQGYSLLSIKVVLLISLLFFGSPIHSQERNDSYNRLRFHQHKWKVLSSTEFQLYFPIGYEDLAAFVSVQYLDIREIQEKKIGRRVAKTPNVIIYPAFNNMMESNIGSNHELKFTDPIILLKGNRVILYFNGSYEDLKSQLQFAITKLIWEETFENINEVFQKNNNSKSKYDWYKEGCIAYFSQNWPLEKENMLKLIFEKEPQLDLESWILNEPVLFGQAFAHFLSIQYRPDANKQIFFQMKGGKSLSRAVRLVVKRPLEVLKQECFEFYKKRFYTNTELTKVVSPDDQIYFDRKNIIKKLQSPDGKLEAVIVEEKWTRKVWLNAVSIPKKMKIAQSSLFPWMTNNKANPYPLLQWSEKNELWSIAHLKGKVQVQRFNRNGVLLQTENLFGVDGVRSFTPLANGELLLSAFKNGRSDIVIFNTQNLKYTPLTDDISDNLEMTVYQNNLNKGIVYRSGYPKDSFNNKFGTFKPYGLYFKETNAAHSKERLLLSDSGFFKAHTPVLLSDDRLLIQHTSGGFINTDTFLLIKDSLILPVSKKIYSPGTWLLEAQRSQKKQDSLKILERKKEDEEPSFLSALFISEEEKKNATSQKITFQEAVLYNERKTRNYFLQLHTAYFSIGIDNNYYINRYQPFKSHLGSFKFPDIGAMINGGVSDLFENHHFNMGYKMPSNGNGSDFFFKYKNTKKRIDWQFLYFRKMEPLPSLPERDWKDEHGNQYPATAKVKTHYYDLSFHLPLDFSTSVGLNLAYRDDKTIFLATDKYSLKFEDLKQKWNINSIFFSINQLYPGEILFLKRGWEMKITLDGMFELKKPSSILYGIRMQMSKHQQLLKGISLVGQLKGGFSEGNKKILYNFGGVDNNVIPSLDSNSIFSQNAPYAFQTLITPFRGFLQNEVYGNAFILMNLDVYFPIFNKIIPLNTPLSSIKNFQIGLFIDVANTAITNKYSFANIKTNYGFGYSLRTSLAGYFIRLDVAWNDQVYSKPVYYFSIGF